MSKEKPKISPEERRWFRDNVSKSSQANDTSTLQAETQNDTGIIPFPQEPDIILNRIMPNDWLLAEDSVYFTRDGISPRNASKLKRGQIACEAQLDLHQLTGNQALEMTRDFLQHSLIQRRRCVLIIHGKGINQQYPGPLLKNLINAWLRELPQVLACVSAPPRCGGTGAIYVLLKTNW